jgi:mono/diheme cytochrome c family protein
MICASRSNVAAVLVSAAVATAGLSAGAQAPDGQAPAADPATCHGLLSQTARVPGVLSGVPTYGSSYVLLIPSRLADKAPTADAPGVKELQVGVQAGTAAVDVARALGLTHVKEYPLDPSKPAQPLQDVKDGTLDAAILWAPLAGLAVIELGLDGQVAIFTVDRPRAGPPALRTEAIADPCAAAIADELDLNGVLPAELLVPVEIRTLLTRRPPVFGLAAARQGAPVYNQICSKCHGPDAVADPHGLAPVDLRISIPRFSYPGFTYIILNGRPEKSMPPLRGTVTDEQIALIYQYLKARSDKLLPASKPSGAVKP